MNKKLFFGILCTLTLAFSSCSHDDDIDIVADKTQTEKAATERTENTENTGNAEKTDKTEKTDNAEQAPNGENTGNADTSAGADNADVVEIKKQLALLNGKWEKANAKNAIDGSTAYEFNSANATDGKFGGFTSLYAPDGKEVIKTRIECSYETANAKLTKLTITYHPDNREPMTEVYTIEELTNGNCKFTRTINADDDNAAPQVLLLKKKR